jgi:hypothetical protein
MPTTTKTSSGFHICDILELNKDKQQQQKNKKSSEKDDDIDDEKKENCENEDVDDEIKVDNDNSECHQNNSSSPSSPQNESQSSSDEVRTPTKHDKSTDFNSSNHSHHQLLNDTIHQYPHLFHNHPAMRPWFNSNGKNKFHSILKNYDNFTL